MNRFLKVRPKKSSPSREKLVHTKTNGKPALVKFLLGLFERKECQALANTTAKTKIISDAISYIKTISRTNITMLERHNVIPTTSYTYYLYFTQMQSHE